jgi:hypothetical protein
MFVLSEPGTWRRYLLLALALIVCLLPRQNPLNHLMVAARRHIDNLIGPPQRPRAAAAGGGGGPAVRGAVPITPEQLAAQILEGDRLRAERERQQQQQPPPNFLRDTFYRIEQAIALFLASLIPGVGERHVEARARTVADYQAQLRVHEEQLRELTQNGIRQGRAERQEEGREEEVDEELEAVAREAKRRREEGVDVGGEGVGGVEGEGSTSTGVAVQRGEDQQGVRERSSANSGEQGS